MTIVVYGAGAVGSFWGGLLSRAGHDVRFVARGRQLDALQTRGIQIASRELGDIVCHPIRASADTTPIGTADLVLVCVKAHQTRGILDDLQRVAGDDTVFVALQNGIEADDVLIERFGARRVIGAVVYVGASIASPGIVSHVAAGFLFLGNLYGVPPDLFEQVVAALTVPGLGVHEPEDFQRQRWYKLMWNTSFNAVSALTRRTSLPLLQARETRAIIVASMREVVAVAQARGVRLTDSDVAKSVAHTEGLPPLRTSMLEDRERGRTMEIEALVGVIVRLGLEAGVPTPVTSTLYGLLKAIDVTDPERR